MEKLPRRTVLIRSAQIVSAFALAPLANRAHGAELACVEHASESLRESMNYADPSPDPAQKCGACGFFDNKAACGYCQIMTGPVSATAHCDSWSAKS